MNIIDNREIIDIDTNLKLNKYIPVIPIKRQYDVLIDNSFELCLNWGLMPGKSTAILMDALQGVDIPEYKALLFCANSHSYILEMVHEWLVNTDVQYNKLNMEWTFPSGASVKIDFANDYLKYATSRFQYIGIDKRIKRKNFLFLSLRLYSLKDCPAKLRYIGLAGR